MTDARAPIAKVAYSPDGTRVATGSENGDVIVWRLANRETPGVLKPPAAGDSAPDVAFSPDGSSLGAVDRSGHVKIWDTRRLRPVRTISGRLVQCGIAWSHGRDAHRLRSVRRLPHPIRTRLGRASGRLLFATRGYDDAMFALAFQSRPPPRRHRRLRRSVRVGDIASGRLVATLRGHTGSVLAVAYSPDGRLIATGGNRRHRSVWDARRGVELLVLQGHNAGIAVEFASDGRRLLTASEDGTARVWDVSPRGGRDWLTLAVRTSSLDGLEFTPDGRELLATGDSEVHAEQTDRPGRPSGTPIRAGSSRPTS